MVTPEVSLCCFLSPHPAKHPGCFRLEWSRCRRPGWRRDACQWCWSGRRERRFCGRPRQRAECVGTTVTLLMDGQMLIIMAYFKTSWVKAFLIPRRTWVEWSRLSCLYGVEADGVGGSLWFKTLETNSSTFITPLLFRLLSKSTFNWKKKSLCCKMCRVS